MLAKKNRFSFKNRLPKQILNSQSFNLRYDKNDEGLKVAVVVSKKIDKRAVVRNKIKRQILEAVVKNINLDKGLTLIFYAKKQTTSSNLENEVIDAVNKFTN